MLINSKCSTYLRKGMVFCIVIGFQDLVNPDGKKEEDKIFGIWIGDTVVVGEV